MGDPWFSDPGSEIKNRKSKIENSRHDSHHRGGNGRSRSAGANPVADEMSSRSKRKLQASDLVTGSTAMTQPAPVGQINRPRAHVTGQATCRQLLSWNRCRSVSAIGNDHSHRPSSARKTNRLTIVSRCAKRYRKPSLTSGGPRKYHP